MVAAGAAAVAVIAEEATEPPVGDADNAFPPAVAPALSQGLGGETDAICVSKMINQQPGIEIDPSGDSKQGSSC